MSTIKVKEALRRNPGEVLTEVQGKISFVGKRTVLAGVASQNIDICEIRNKKVVITVKLEGFGEVGTEEKGRIAIIGSTLKGADTYSGAVIRENPLKPLKNEKLQTIGYANMLVVSKEAGGTFDTAATTMEIEEEGGEPAAALPSSDISTPVTPAPIEPTIPNAVLAQETREPIQTYTRANDPSQDQERPQTPAAYTTPPAAALHQPPPVNQQTTLAPKKGTRSAKVAALRRVFEFGQRLGNLYQIALTLAHRQNEFLKSQNLPEMTPEHLQAATHAFFIQFERAKFTGDDNLPTESWLEYRAEANNARPVGRVSMPAIPPKPSDLKAAWLLYIKDNIEAVQEFGLNHGLLLPDQPVTDWPERYTPKNEEERKATLQKILLETEKPEENFTNI